MKIILNSLNLKKELSKIKDLGFVPTMGSIHRGHEHLIKSSKKRCKKTLVSIFVNPTQFDNYNDFKKYPINIKKDLRILKRLNVDIVFVPKTKDIYDFKRKEKIRLKKKELILCAKYRKGHFEGVLDVMDRFTKLICPKKIFMGEKDFQQYFLVKRLIERKYPTKIIKCKTIRNNANVALSSRNLLLKKRSLNIAANIFIELKKIKKNIKKQKNIEEYLKRKIKYLTRKNNIKIDYLELRNEKNLVNSKVVHKSKLFIAYYINKVRLIDNL